MALDKRGERIAEGGQPLLDEGHRTVQLESETAVHDVLRRGPQVYRPSQLLWQGGVELTHQAQDRVAHRPRAVPQPGDIDGRGVGADIYDRCCLVRGDDAQARLGLGEGGLDLHPGLDGASG
jgi:hypothetical protein